DGAEGLLEVVGGDGGEHLELIVGSLQLGSALLDPALELGVELPDLLLGALALGDVLGGAFDPGGSGAGLDLGAGVEPAQDAVGADDPELEVERLSGLAGTARG